MMTFHHPKGQRFNCPHSILRINDFKLQVNRPLLSHSIELIKQDSAVRVGVIINEGFLLSLANVMIFFHRYKIR